MFLFFERSVVTEFFFPRNLMNNHYTGGSHWVNRQPSNGLKFNRQPSKKVLFYRQPLKMQIDINRQKVLRYLKLHFSADLHRLRAPEESLNWKT